VLNPLRWCWCWALWQYLVKKRKYFLLRRSHHIRGIHHALVADDLKDVEIEESVPEGPKQRGWRGVWHALTARWTVRKGRDE